eukprot:gene6676-7193_t
MPPKQNPKAAAPSASSNSNRAYLECTEGSSNKFYEIVFNEKDSSVFTRYGPIGKDGVSATKNFKSKEEARKFYDKTLQEKLKKGYEPATNEDEDEEEEEEEEEPPKKSTKSSSSKNTSSAKSGNDADDESEVTVEEDTCSETSDENDQNKDEEEEEEEEEDPNHAYLECVEGNSSKFYELTRDGTKVTTSYGRIGAKGTTSTKDYKTEEAAEKFFEKTLEEKLNKGYERAVKEGEEKVKKDAKSAIAFALMPLSIAFANLPTFTPSSFQLLTPWNGPNNVSLPSIEEERVYLENAENNFAEIVLKGLELSKTVGKVGTCGSPISCSHLSEKVARTHFNESIQSFINDGYRPKSKPQNSSSKTGGQEDDFDDVSDVTVEEDTCSETSDEDGSGSQDDEYDYGAEDAYEEEEEEEDPNHAYLECVEGNSSKFYELTRDGTKVTTSYGRIGAKGTTSTKDYKTEEAAEKFFEKTLEEKLNKGYERAVKEDDDDEEEEVVYPKPKAKKATKKTAEKADSDDEMDVEDDEPGIDYGNDPNHAYLECTEGTSSKFYELVISKTSVSTTYGRIGAGGSTATKDYGTVQKARDFYDKTLNEKLRKGYHHATKKDIPSIRPPVPAPVRATKAVDSPIKSAPNSKVTNKNFAYLICQEGTSNKFYEIILQEEANSVYTRYGRINTTGMESRKDFGSKEEARKFFDKTLQEKLKKGYSHSKPDENFGQDSGLVETKEDEKPAAAKGKKRGKAEVDPEPEEEEEQPKKRATKSTKSAPPPAAKAPPAKAAPAKAAPVKKEVKTEKAGLFAYLEFEEGKSSKFYEISTDGTTVNSRYGRIGTTGQTTSKSFDTTVKAELFYQKTLSEKLLKGYQQK